MWSSLTVWLTVRIFFSQKEITKTQCDLLVPNLKNPKTIALVKEDIKNMSDRSPSRCVDVLVTVLEEVFEFKKQHMAVRLRCSGCSRTVPYVSIRPKAWPCCYGHDVNCAYCGSWGGSAKYYPCSPCRGCGKRFR